MDIRAPLRQIRLFFSQMADKPRTEIADREFTSRLILGTGKFASNELIAMRSLPSGTDGTVALRRADLSRQTRSVREHSRFHRSERFFFCRTRAARETRKRRWAARLAASAGLPKWIKLEIHPTLRYFAS